MRWATVLVLLFWGCSENHLSRFDTISIPLAESSLQDVLVAAELTSATIKVFTEDGGLFVVDEGEVVLRLNVLKTENRVRDVERTDTTLYVFSIVVEAQFIDNQTGQLVFYIPELTGWGTYNNSYDRPRGISRALRMAANGIRQKAMED